MHRPCIYSFRNKYMNGGCIFPFVMLQALKYPVDENGKEITSRNDNITLLFRKYEN